MFARNAHFRLKSLTMATEFALAFENEILPLLHKQAGFKGEITLSNPGSLEQIAISLWEDARAADAYNMELYPQIVTILAKLIVGTPKIRTYESVTLSLEQDHS